ncbi:MAG: amidohydrolase family protein [Thermodesulfobacteriota bacterium]
MTLVPELILWGGDLRTQDPDRPRAEALALAQGRILAMGQSQEIKALAGPRTRIVDLAGRLVLPGLVDSHFHYRAWTLFQRELNLAETPSLTGLLDQVARGAAAKAPGAWITGQGWNETGWPENRQPVAADLDQVAPNHPVLLWRADLHLAVANSKALALAGLNRETPDPPGGEILRDERGRPDGRLREAAVDLVRRPMPETTEDEYYELFREGQKVLHAAGLTGLTDVPLMNDQGGAAKGLRVWQRLEERGELRLRVCAALPGESLELAAALGLRTGLGGDRLRIGPLKYFADGGMGARTAWMFEPYLDGGTGLPLMDLDLLREKIGRADRAGLSVMVHAIGDRANHEVISLFEDLEKNRRGPGPRLPHRMEHVQMIRPEDIQRLGRLAVIACLQPPNLVIDINMIEQCVGPRGRLTYAFRDLIEAGVRVIFSSDAPVCDYRPLAGIHAAVTRQRADGTPAGGWHPDQRIGLDQAVKAYTLAPARAAGLAGRLGALAPGKLADLVVLDRNLYQIPPEEIHRTRVDLTVVGGRIVYQGSGD